MKDNIYAAAGIGITLVQIVSHLLVLGARVAVGVAVAVDPIPIGPDRVRIAQLVGSDTDDLSPPLPIVPEGAQHVVGAQTLVHSGVALPAKSVVPQIVARLAEHHFNALAPPGGDLLYLSLVGIDGQLGVGGGAPVDIVFRRVVGGIGVRAPHIPRPQAGRHIPKHLIVEVGRADIASGAERPIQHNNPAVADTADGIGCRHKKLTVLLGVGLAAPFHIQVRLIPNLNIQIKSVAFGQALGHAFEGSGHTVYIRRLVPITATGGPLQAHNRLQSPVIGTIDKINPALFRVLGVRADTVEHLLDIAVPANQVFGAIQLPVQIALIAAAILHKCIDTDVGVIAPGGEGSGGKS